MDSPNICISRVAVTKRLHSNSLSLMHQNEKKTKNSTRYIWLVMLPKVVHVFVKNFVVASKPFSLTTITIFTVGGMWINA